jgi:hypothetical protein
MKDLGYNELVDLWAEHPELIKYQFPLDAYFNRYMRAEYALLNDRPTTERVLKVMSEYGYRCSIAEALLVGANPSPQVVIPKGYEIHELPADYTGRVWIESQVRSMCDYAEPQGDAVPVEKQIAEALRTHGLTLVKKSTGYAVLKLGTVQAQSTAPQPKQKPVKDRLDFLDLFDENQRLRAELKFNTAPQPQREWVSLTDEEIELVFSAQFATGSVDVHSLARAIEAKLKEKNNGS